MEEMETHTLPYLSLSFPFSPGDFIQTWVWQDLSQEPEGGRRSRAMASSP